MALTSPEETLSTSASPLRKSSDKELRFALGRQASCLAYNFLKTWLSSLPCTDVSASHPAPDPPTDDSSGSSEKIMTLIHQSSRGFLTWSPAGTPSLDSTIVGIALRIASYGP